MASRLKVRALEARSTSQFRQPFHWTSYICWPRECVTNKADDVVADSSSGHRGPHAAVWPLPSTTTKLNGRVQLSAFVFSSQGAHLRPPHIKLSVEVHAQSMGQELMMIIVLRTRELREAEILRIYKPLLIDALCL